MSTRVSGKRVGYDDFFGSSSSPTNKKSKWSSFGSPIRSSETGSGSDDPVASLIHMFPSMDPEFVTAPRPEFLIFVVFDSFALFISLAVVVVQTSVVVIERKAKKQMMAIINKLMWMACIMISVAFVSLSFVVVGKKEMPLAVGVTAIGALIMVSTLGTMCYWVIANRIEGSKSSPASMMSDPELADSKHNRKLYAV